jgi:hypothetical protein
MTIKFKIATANCGNDTPGNLFNDKLGSVLVNTDVLILSCQETNKNETLAAINAKLAELNEGAKDARYTCTASELMTTHTKPNVFLKDTTGIVTFVIHRTDIDVNFTQTIQARRSNKKSLIDNSYNKGGLISKISITEAGKTYQLHNVNAHLESYSASNRLLDWSKIFNAYHNIDVSSFEELVDTIPDCLTLGMDANTRNFELASSPWDEDATLECQALAKACLSDELYSKNATYKTNKVDAHTKKSKYRPGRINHGSLDIVGTLNATQTLKPGTEKKPLLLRDETVEEIGLAGNDSKRDHHIIISPEQSLDDVDSFSKVQNFMAHSLKQLAPDLSVYIKLMANSQDNRDLLCQLYQQFFANENSVLKQYLVHEKAKINSLYAIYGAEARLHYWPLASLEEDNVDDRLALLIANDKLVTFYETAFYLDTLKNEFRSNAKDDGEQAIIDVIIAQSISDLNLLINESDMANFEQNTNTLVEQTRCLLQSTHEIYSYQKHLEQYADDSELSKSKLSIVDSLQKTILASKKNIEQRCNALRTKVQDIDPIITNHRDNKFWHVIYRALKSIFSKDAFKTKGQITLNTVGSFFKPVEEKKETPKEQTPDFKPKASPDR